MTTNFTRRRYEVFEITEPALNTILTFSRSLIDCLSTRSREEVTSKDKISSVASILLNSKQTLPGM